MVRIGHHGIQAPFVQQSHGLNQCAKEIVSFVVSLTCPAFNPAHHIILMLGQIQHHAHVIPHNETEAIGNIVDGLLPDQLAEPALVVIGLVLPVVGFTFPQVGPFGSFRCVVLGKFGHPFPGLVRGKQVFTAAQWRGTGQIDFLQQRITFL